MANPNYTTQDVPTWAANVDSMNALQTAGNISNPLLFMPLLNSLAMVKGVGSITFSRSSIGTYIDRYGVLQTAAIDEPRFEKNGLLMERASTNVFTRSEEFDHTDWALSGTMTRTSGQSSPDGGTNAYLLNDTDVADDLALIQNTFTIANDSLIRTVSIFLKEDTAAVTRLSTFNTGGTTVSASVNITWATKSAVFSGGTGTFTELVGSGGWYRVDINITNNSSGNTIWLHRIYPAGQGPGLTGSVVDANVGNVAV